MTRGVETRVFLDADQWLADHQRLSRACNWVVQSIDGWKKDGHRVDGLAFVDKDSGPVGMLAMQHLVGGRSGLPTCLVRLRRWPFLPQAAVKGHIPERGSVFVIVSDVVTTGGHIGRAAEVLRHECWGIDVDLALVLLNRGKDQVTSHLRGEHITVRSMPEVQAEFEARLKAGRAEEEHPH